MKNEPSDKTPNPNKQRGEYNDKLKVKGSFLDIIQASVKNVNDEKADKKKIEPEP